jgi:ribonuclease HII
MTAAFTAGVDEAGRGPLAGPVYAAAVILDPDRPVEGLTDSKLLAPAERERLAVLIRSSARAWAVSWADVHEIDAINILQASLLAMQRAVAALNVAPRLALVDGNRAPKFSCRAKAIIQGDLSQPAISAASILAKVERDAEMCRLARHYPGYGFENHKGYGTREHLEALDRLGVCSIHRRSFEPVRSRMSVSSLPLFNK